VQPRVDLVHDRDEVLPQYVAQGVHLCHVLQDLVQTIRLQKTPLAYASVCSDSERYWYEQ
jgi:hypothetical protein